MSDQSINVVNTTNNKQEVVVDEDTSLKTTLSNTGAPIKLDKSSSLLIYMPRYFTSAELSNMDIVLADWAFPKYDPSIGALKLTFTKDDGIWSGALEFDITGVKASGTPTMDSIQINFDGMPGAAPQLTQPLPLVKKPVVGNLDLSKVLEVSLDNRGSIYVSDKFDPLANTLFLNVKNTGDTDLYTGSGMPTGAQIEISCTYGNTSGALAPAKADTPTSQPLGSAWNIVPAMGPDQTEGWQIAPPLSTDKFPVWRASPQATNHSLIGTGAASNVTFELQNIIALTPVGHTQVTVSFSGFQKTETQNYDPLVIVLDIYKQAAPPTRGLINFFGSSSPIIPVADATTGTDIPLRWAMADVNSVLLISSFDGVAPVSRVYAKPPATPKALDYDHYTLRLPPTAKGGPVTLTLQARDGSKAFLNTLQYTAYLQMSVFVDPRDKKEYPIALLGNRYWMIKNLDYEKEGTPYNDDPANGPLYGRLYQSNAQSVQTPPGGWRLPAQTDWQDLIDLVGGAEKAYPALMQAGPDQFSGKLGGQYVPSGSGADYTDLLLDGFYWNTGGFTYANLNSQSKTVSPGGANVPPGAGFSVRYVLDL